MEPLVFATDLFFATECAHFLVVLVVRSRDILSRHLIHCRRRHLCPRRHRRWNRGFIKDGIVCSFVKNFNLGQQSRLTNLADAEIW